MTISWLTAVDNRSHFMMSMNANRRSLHNLRAWRRGTLDSPATEATPADDAEHTSDDPVGAHFTLSVAIDGMQHDLLRISSVHGDAEACKGTGKVAALGVDTCLPGLRPWRCSEHSESGRRKHARMDGAAASSSACTCTPIPCLTASPAHMVCRVETVMMDSVHAVAPAGKRRAAGANDLGHVLLLCSIQHAYVRPAAWSRTVYHSRVPLLSFLGTGTFAITRATVDVETEGGVETVTSSMCADGADEGSASCCETGHGSLV